MDQERLIQSLSWQQDNYFISTDKSRLDLEMMLRFFQSSYWAQNRSMHDVIVMVDNSICFGLYDQEKQVGFGRVLSDLSILSYLADIFILPEYRGKGLGMWLTETILSCSLFAETKKWLLATKDAHEFYARVGFTPHPYPERMMQLSKSQKNNR